MAADFADWDDVAAFARTLPGTEASTYYGQPAIKVRAKAFICAGREPGSFVLMAPLADKAVLIETDPDTFWETPHYTGWPALLVRYGTPSRDRVEILIGRAWWDRASPLDRAAYGPRP